MIFPRTPSLMMYLWKKVSVSSSPFLKGQSQQGNHWSLPFSPGTDFNWKDLPPFQTRILTSSHIKPVATYWSVFFFFPACFSYLEGIKVHTMPNSPVVSLNYTLPTPRESAPMLGPSTSSVGEKPGTSHWLLKKMVRWGFWGRFWSNLLLVILLNQYYA